MKNKNIVIVLLVALLVWNGFLTYQVFSDSASSSEQTGDNSPTITNQTFTDTDFTKAVEKTSSKAVGVTTDRGEGSGVIYSKKNDEVIIATNNHVVQGASTVSVLFSNGKEVEAEVLGTDVYTDLAALKVKVDFNVEPFKIGDSSALKIGEWVLAIGSPVSFEFYGSVTEGVISGKDRQVPVDLDGDRKPDWDMLVMQTSAAINPGNSGGPLINLNGELVGINSMKLASEKIEGMGFSIPINEAVPILEQLINEGEVVRPLIGVSARDIADIPPYYRNFFNIPMDIEKGILVSEVQSGGAAQKGGVKGGDIIKKINDVEIEQFKDFRREIYNHKPNDTITIIVIRDSKEVKLDVTLQ